jgi:hypothetical protein
MEMKTLVGFCLLLLAFLLGVMEYVAIMDPAQTALANDGDPYAPPAPWYVHAAWFAVMGSMAAAGLWLLNRGILGRLVRGRGLTPAPR